MHIFKSIRSYSTKVLHKNANTIRKDFLNYFANDLQHTTVRSSPVALCTDHSIAFVNAGMNQFKGIFLNYYDPPATKVTNSQKCIRVGGKHNDLECVGNDAYHHTFFEMLGNWSFGDYFKEESCRYALDLLTNVYNIKKEYLYVTYFAGNEALKLEPDVECRDIWMALGIPKDRVLPFGIDTNFWEMGLSGPCGPCTEIHVNMTAQSAIQSTMVNTGHPNLIELWNIVFMQYERLPNSNVIVPLPKYHVDTGLGFERLVRLLQKKESNYDTDLFQPLFHAIQNYTNAPEYKGKFGKDDAYNVDYAYRILSDHSRMITVSLADGMLPEQNQKLRRILRKGIEVGENILNKKGILSELAYSVMDTLGDAYPELQKNINQVRKIIDFEEDLYEKLRATCGKEWKQIVTKQPQLRAVSDWTASGLVGGYKDLQSILKENVAIRTSGVLPGYVAFKLYDTHGLSKDTIRELALIESLHFDEAAFKKEMDRAKYRSKIGILKDNGVLEKVHLSTLKECLQETDDSHKYKYICHDSYYEFPSLECKLLGLITNDSIIVGDQLREFMSGEKNTTNLLSIEKEIGLLFDKTMFYSFEGGQISDKGRVCIKDHIFNVNNVRKTNGYVIHFGNFVKNDEKNPSARLKQWDDCLMIIDTNIRIGAMIHHTTTHLLNAALKKIMQATSQRSSVVNVNNTKFQFRSFGEKVTAENISQIEQLVNNAIKARASVETKVVNSLQLAGEDDITIIPGEIYPHTGIRIIDINTQELKSKEPCCGTHVHNTEFLQCFCILNYSSKGASNRIIEAIAGPLAKIAKTAGEEILRQVSHTESKVKTGNFDIYELSTQIDNMKQKLINKNNLENPIPYLIKQDCTTILKNLSKVIQKQEKRMKT